jgi:signal transduction histidine kinase
MKQLFAVAAACLTFAVVVLLLSWTTYFSQFNSSAFDFTLRIAGEIKPASPTVIVAIDEDSVRRVGRWPWSRDKLAVLLDRIQEGKPRTIAMDVLLDDTTEEASDRALADAISRVPSIVLAARVQTDTSTPRWLKPNPMFLQPHVRLGHVQTDPDLLDSVMRHIDSAKAVAGVGMLAFSLETVEAAGFPQPKYKPQIAGATLHVSEPVTIRFVGGRHTFPHISAADTLDNKVTAGEFKDRIVLVGFTADGGQDQWFTPFAADQQKMSGVEIHANAIDTFYASRQITTASDIWMLSALFAVTFLLWWMDRHRTLEGWRFYVLAVLLLPGTAALSWALMKYGNTWMAFPPMWAAIVLVVPGLEVLEITRVNRDLDSKIQRLSIWDTSTSRRDDEWDARQKVQSDLPAGPERDAWLSAIQSTEKQSAGREIDRKRLLAAPQRNARWRLQAVDFFNEDLLRFLSFNNAILSSIEDVIIVADPSGRVVYQNPPAQRLHRYSEDPPFAPDYLKALLDGRSLMTVFAGAFAGSGASTLEFVPSRDGKRRYNVTVAPISNSGVVVSLHDSTAQFDLDQAKNDMVSLVSHELRTPLTSIRGYSDMLVKYDLVADKGKPFLSTIIDESRRLSNLIQSFLDIAYIESGRQKINATDFEVGPMINDMTGILGPLAAEKRIRLQTPANIEGAWIRGDRLLLYQAVSNLVTNAIKYSPSGTTVRVNVTNGDGRVRFHIADQGCGIPADETAKVFEKFFRRGNKETREQSGFGLGLAFVKEVAVKHGGDVLVESEVGKGSVFTLWIPN